MNSTQLKHALSRAAAIYSKRYAAVTDMFTTPEVKLTAEARLDALKNGEFVVKSAKYTRYSTPRENRESMWVWLDFADRWITFNAEFPAKVNGGLFAAQEKLTAEHERLKDLLHLGETSEALRLLEAYSQATPPLKQERTHA